MSEISEFFARQKDFNDRQAAALAGLNADVVALKDLIRKLQGSPVTPDDKALLDQLEAQAKSAAEKLEALDAMTPPAV